MMMLKTAMRGFAVAITLAVAPSMASAQGLFFDWGGEQTYGGSGKQVVSFRGGSPGELIASFSDRKLYFVLGNGQAISYPIATPRDQSRWSGVTSVSTKRENPSWTPTPAMRAENPRLPMWVPGGHPMNPLGVRALYLGASAYRIHGTDAPWTIGTNVSKGCIRMYNQDVLDLYPRVKVGAKVTVTWNRYSTEAVASNSDASEEARPERPKRYLRPIQSSRRPLRPMASAGSDAQTE
jgi:lipoprotein-anchoring transpeptidase ErfK/SrfK